MNERSAALHWDVAGLSRGQQAVSLAIFALTHAALVALGHALRGEQGELTILWPSSGLLLWALWFAPRSMWLWIVGAQVAVEVIADVFGPEPMAGQWALAFALADSLEAIVGATLARRLVPEPAVARVMQVVKFGAAAALGAGVSATIGAFGAVRALGQVDYWQQWQVWWTGNVLGILTILPAALCWAVRYQAPEKSVAIRSRLELAAVALLLWTLTALVFVAPAREVTVLLQLPVALLVVLMYAAFRLPPRWSTLLAATCVIAAALLASRGLGPFSADATRVAGIGELQFFLATLVGVSFMLSVALLEQRNTFERLRESEERYRTFVARSTEAVWRIELRLPMPVALAPEEQAQWVRLYGFVAECNMAYRRLQADSTGAAVVDMPDTASLRPAPLLDDYFPALETAIRQGFKADGLRFSIKVRGRMLHYLLSFAGVEQDGRLIRVWGLARDITELSDLSQRLVREQDRLRSYAQQLISAEERARRATAVDLHDGIGQMLTGLSFSLESVSRQAPTNLRVAIEEARRTVTEVQDKTRGLIADLSPPGLYELGLVPALQWLAVQLRSQHQLQVDLSFAFTENRIPLDLRVLVFKIVRELLRNVVKHAGTPQAAVVVRQSGAGLEIEVTDAGVGFEWQMDLFDVRNASFGLWSVADRVRTANGHLVIDTAPGHGCQIRIDLPLP